MSTPEKNQVSQHRPTRRFALSRLWSWVDTQESPSKKQVLVAVIVAAILGVCALFRTAIFAAIPLLAKCASLLRTEFLLKLWMLAVCILVPFLGMVYLLSVRQRRPLIHSAKYGANTQFDDVKPKVEKEVRCGRRSIPAENSFFGDGNPAYDPCRDVFKSLTIDYCVRGKRKEKTVKEHEVIYLD